MDAIYRATENIAKAVHAAQTELRNPPCDAVNGHFGQRYATLASIIDHVRPVLAKHGLAIIQGIETDASGLLILETRLIHASGESWAYRTGYRHTGNIQQFCGTITYLRRYAICAMLNIVADHDLDAEDVVRPKPAKAKPSETRQVIPEGFEEITPIQVECKASKSGKDFYSIVFARSSGEQDQASTFNSTIGERLAHSLGQKVAVLIARKEKNGKIWKDIKDAI